MWSSIPNQFGPYRIVQEIGQGGMGIVFLAEDTKLRRHVAIKFMLPHAAANPEAKARFLREVQSMAVLKSDHIVTVYAIDEFNGSPYFVMEYLTGLTLEAYRQTKPRFSWHQIVRIGSEVASGLSVAHAKRLIHRDIKPANLFLEKPRGRIKILDFGLVRPMDQVSSLTQSGTIMGTPYYMAPEQARGKKEVDPRADLFSLGAVLYEMITERVPFEGESFSEVIYALATEIPPPIKQLRPEAPQSLSDLVDYLLAKKPEDRPISAEKVYEALVQIEMGLPIEAPIAIPWEASLQLAPIEPSAQPPVLLPSTDQHIVLGDHDATHVARNPFPTHANVGSAVTTELGLQFAWIPAGEFWMGSDKTSSEKPRSRKIISHGFWMGRHPITQKQWKTVVGTTPSYFKGEDLPVERVSWDDCYVFLEKLRELTGMQYRLPTEAEWEYACHAGSETNYCFGDSEKKLTEYAWFRDNSSNRTRPVGTCAPNSWGLFDMHGNVWEWCEDWFGIYDTLGEVDPVQMLKNPDHYRVLRGGAWNSDAFQCRATNRYGSVASNRTNSTGFRICLRSS
jgi:eukaryotic-like serine/threonine-protein kinase